MKNYEDQLFFAVKERYPETGIYRNDPYYIVISPFFEHLSDLISYLKEKGLASYEDNNLDLDAAICKIIGKKEIIKNLISE